MSLVIAPHLPKELQQHIQTYSRPKNQNDYTHHQNFKNYKCYLYNFFTQKDDVSPYLYHLALISQSLEGPNQSQYLIVLYTGIPWNHSNHYLLEIGYNSLKIEKVVVAYRNGDHYDTYQEFPLHDGWVLALLWWSKGLSFDLTQQDQLNPKEQEAWKRLVEMVETNMVMYLKGVSSLWGMQYVYWHL